MFMKNLSTRLLLLLIALLGNVGLAVADNIISIEDFEIEPGQQKQLVIMVSTEAGELTQVEGDMALPAGLKIVGQNSKVTSETGDLTPDANIAMTFAGHFNVRYVPAAPFASNSGSIIKFYVEATEDLAQSSTITFSNLKVKLNGTKVDATGESVKVSRPAPAPDPVAISLNASGLQEFEAEGGSQEVKFTANAAWTVAGAPAWLTITPNSGEAGDNISITIQASANEATEAREAVVSFTATQGDDTKTATLTISQKAKEPEAEPAVYTTAFDQTSIALQPGETATVDVLLTNNFELYTLEGQLVASEGITIQSVEKTRRVVGTFNYNANKQKVRIFNLAGPAIQDEEGAVFTVTVAANENFEGTATLTFSGIKASDVKTTNYNGEDITVSFEITKPVFIEEIEFTPAATEVELTPGKTATVDLQLANNIAVKSFEADLTLPAGVTATAALTGRASGTAVVTEKGKLVVLCLPDGIAEGEGAFVTLTLAADETFAADGVLALNNLHYSVSGVDATYDGSISVNLKYVKDTAEEEALQEIKDDLQDKLDEAVNKIETDYPDAVDDTKDDVQAIQDDINEIPNMSLEDAEKAKGEIEDDIEKLLDKAEEIQAASGDALQALKDQLNQELNDAWGQVYTNYPEATDDLIGDKNNIEAAINALTDANDAAAVQAIRDDIQKLLADAAKIQGDADNALAALQKELQDKLDAANAKIASDYPAAVEDTKADAAAIQGDINGLSGKMLDEAVAAKPGIEKAIDDMLAKAKDIQKTYADKDKKDQQIADLQKLLDDAKAKIYSDYPNASDDTSGEVNDIQDMIDALKDAPYNASNAAPIKSAISQLLKDAEAIQKQHDASEAKYADLQKQLDAAKKAFEDAKTELGKDLDKVKDEADAIADMLDQLQAELNDLRAADALTKNSTLDTKPVYDAIDVMKAHATGINSIRAIMAAEGDVVIYDTTGKVVTNPVKGQMVIVKSATSVKKLIIK